MRHRVLFSLWAILALVVTGLTVVASGLPADATPTLGALAGSGPRPGATRYAFYAGDSVQAQVDVGSGNLMVTVKTVALPDVGGKLQLGAYYNSAVGVTDTTLPRLGGRGWGLDDTDDIRMVPETATPSSSAVTYRGPGGLVAVFTPVAGSGNPVTYTPPARFDMTLTYDSNGYKLVDNQTQQTRLFNTSGLLTTVKDRNGNATTTTSGSSTTTIRTAANTVEPATAIISKPSSTTTQIKQGSSTTLRTATFTTTGETVSKFTDALGRDTTFDYFGTSGTNAGLLKRVTAPGGVILAFSYDASNRLYSVNSWDPNLQMNLTTRFQHTTVNGISTTYVADPTTSGSSNPDSVPHTTYSMDSTDRVVKAVDAVGRERPTSYTPNADTTLAVGGSGPTGRRANAVYGPNGYQSLPKANSGLGTSDSVTYANSSGPAQYLPSSSTDDAGNTSTYTYDSAGNQLTATDAGSSVNKLTYNADGTVATALSAGNGTNTTKYGYTNKQLTSITPVTGSSLGSRAFTYDSFGRTKTATNGRGITRTYTYDNLDRVTKIAFSDGSQVTYGYDAAGNLNNRVDVNGTTTWVYDPIGRLTSRQNTFFGGTVSYGYDKASRMVTSNTSLGGTVTYVYDQSGLPTSITYPIGGSTGLYTIDYDNQGRQVSAKLGVTNGGDNYTASATYSYTTAGKISSVTANTGPNTANVVDFTYCYAAGTTAAGGCTESNANRRNRVQWRRDATQYDTAVFAYDKRGRIKQQQETYDGNIAGPNFQYGYDARGNRTSATPAPGSDTGNQNLTFNSADQISTSGYTYDGAGNLTADPASGNSGISYTAADQAKAGTGPDSTWSVRYGGVSNDEMLDQNSIAGDYQYLYGRGNQYGLPSVEQMTRVVNQNGTVNTYNTSFINNPVTGQPLIQITHTGAVNMYVYAGNNGASIELLAANGNVALAERYDPYGVPIIAQGYGSDAHEENPYDFSGTGVEMRETAWVHYGNRYFSPLTGRFTQQDLSDSPLDMSLADRYLFAADDPVNNVDPTQAAPVPPPTPRTPDNPSITPCVTNCTNSWSSISTTTPSLSASSSDPNHSNVTYTWQIADPSTDQVLYQTITAGKSGATAQVAVPSGTLLNNGAYEWRVQASNPDGSSPWTAWQFFTVTPYQAPKAPDGLELSPCADDCPSMTSTSTTPVLGASLNGHDAENDAADFQVRNASQTVIASGSDNNPRGDGVRYAVPAGKLSDGQSYSFRVGANDGTNETWSGWTDFTVQVPAAGPPPTGLKLSTPCEGACSDAVSSSAMPTFTATNASGSAADITFDVTNGQEGNDIKGVVSGVSSGGTATWKVPTGALGSNDYDIRAGTNYGAATVWSASIPFQIDASDGPDRPSADAPKSGAAAYNPSWQPAAESQPNPQPYNPQDVEDMDARIAASNRQAINQGQQPNSDAVVANRAISIQQQYAPLGWLYPSEQDSPLSADTFINHSSLDWSDDQGCGPVGVAAPVSEPSMGSGVYKQNEIVHSYVPHAPPSCPQTGTRWSSTDPVRPWGSGGPPGAEGMYLDLDSSAQKGGPFTSSAPVYYILMPGKYVQYWFLWGENHAYNDVTGGTRVPFLDNHEGDWEHITVFLKSLTSDAPNTAWGVQYSYHDTGGCFLPWQNVPRNKGGNHPLLWFGRGTHASYPAKYVPPLLHQNSYRDQVSGAGSNVVNATKNLYNLPDQPWYRYGGGWGQVSKAVVFAGTRTGPEGPDGMKDVNPSPGSACSPDGR